MGPHKGPLLLCHRELLPTSLRPRVSLGGADCPYLDAGFSSQSMHQQQQLQHQQFQKELEKIQLLQQQQLPFHPPGDVAQDAEPLDSSGLYSESSGTSSPSTSPRASNHSLHSSGSASRPGSGPFPEQDDDGKTSCCFLFSFQHSLRAIQYQFLPGSVRGITECRF